MPLTNDDDDVTREPVNEGDDAAREPGSEIPGATEGSRQVGYSPARRRFLVYLMYALGTFGAAIIGVPLIAWVFQPMFQQPPDVWRVVGRVGDFSVGQTVKVTFVNAYTPPFPAGGVSTLEAAWLRRDSATHFTAFSEYCQHLGCPVTWQPGPDLFFCPCHGGVYYANGTVASGPPPRALQQYKTRVRNGHVELLTGPIPFPY